MKRELLYALINRKRDLSYRYFKRLSKIEQKIYIQSDIEPKEGLLALKHKVIIGCSLIRSIKWAKRNYFKYMQYLTTRDFYRKPLEKAKFAEKELIFQGWVPLDNFRMKEKRYHYLITPTMINGTKYIYPFHFKDLEGPDINQAKIGLAGYTRILYKKKYRQ